MIAERWLPCAGFDGYEVSDLGRVRSWHQRTVSPRLLKPTPGRGGYLYIGLYPAPRAERQVKRKVHHLVLEAFAGPRPDPKSEARHGDGVRTNNVPGNLRWGTSTQNKADRKAHGRGVECEKNPKAVLTANDVRAIRRSSASCRSLAVLYDVTPSTIQRAQSGETWRDLPGKVQVRPKPKLPTPEDVIEIRRQLDQGRSQQIVANDVGFSQTTVSKIARGLRWARV